MKRHDWRWDWRHWRAAWLATWAIVLVVCLVLWLVAGCTLVWVEGDGNRVTEPGGDVHVERSKPVGGQRKAP